MKSQTVEVRLLGQKIALRAPGMEPSLVSEVAELVAGRLKEAEQRGKSATAAPHHVALLALFDLAQEYVHAKHRYAGHRRALEDKSQELFSLLENEMK